ncbi:hypothetical protein BaRGS_00037979, partial [Batillaria attramentaria]
HRSDNPKLSGVLRFVNPSVACPDVEGISPDNISALESRGTDWPTKYPVEVDLIPTQLDPM